MKLFVRLTLVLILLLAVAAGVGYYYADELARRGVEEAATTSLGVETKVASMKLGLISGACEAGGIHVANPEGFESEHFLKVESAKLEASVWDLTGDEIEAKSLVIRGVDMALEKKGDKANYEVIADNLGVFEDDKDEPDDTTESSKRYVVRELLIQDVTVRVDVLPEVGKLARTEVKIPELNLTDIGSDSDGGVVLAQVTDIIVKAVLEAVAKKAGQLPFDIAADLTGELSKLTSLEGFGPKVVGDVQKKLLEGAGDALRGTGDVVGDVIGGSGKTVGDVTDGAGKVVGDVVGEAGKTVQGIGEGVGKLLGGDKDEKEDKKTPPKPPGRD